MSPDESLALAKKIVQALIDDEYSEVITLLAVGFSGMETGRTSSKEPNTANVPKEACDLSSAKTSYWNLGSRWRMARIQIDAHSFRINADHVQLCMVKWLNPTDAVFSTEFGPFATSVHGAIAIFCEFFANTYGSEHAVTKIEQVLP